MSKGIRASSRVYRDRRPSPQQTRCHHRLVSPSKKPTTQTSHPFSHLTFIQTSMSHVSSDNGPLDLMYNSSYRFALSASAPSEVYLKNTYYKLRIYWDSFLAFQNSSPSSLAMTIRTSVLRNKQPKIIKANLEF